MTKAQTILESIERAFEGCVDDEATARLNEMWDAREMQAARELTAEAGIEWDFESWEQTVRLIQSKQGQWAALWQPILTIWTSNGQAHPEFTDYTEAREYLRKSVLASDEIHATDWFTTDDGDAQCCYATKEAMDADRDGAYAPKIERAA